MVGDRMDTDVVAGIEAGLETVLVLSGSTAAADVAALPVPAQPDPGLDRRRHRPGLRTLASAVQVGEPGLRAWPAGTARRPPPPGPARRSAGARPRTPRRSPRARRRSAPRSPGRGPTPATRARPTRRQPRAPAATSARMTTSARARARLSGVLVRVSQSQVSAPTATRRGLDADDERRPSAATAGPPGAAARGGAPTARQRRRTGARPAGAAAAAAPAGSVTGGEITRRARRARAVPPAGNRPALVNLAVMRALVVVNPAATSTTAKMRDVLVGALGSELKLDVAETAHRGHARELGAAGGRRRHRPRRVRGRRRHRQRGRQRPARERARAAPADARRRARRLDQRLLPGAGPLAGPGRGDRGDPRLAARRPHPAGLPRHGQRHRHQHRAAGRAGPGRRREAARTRDPAPGRPRWFVFAAGLGFDAEVIARVEAQRGRGPALHRRALRPGGRQRPSCSAGSAAGRR